MNAFGTRAGALLCAASIMGLVSMPLHAKPRKAADSRSVSAIVIDVGSGKTLYEARADQLRAPASLTKMMTLLLAFDALRAGGIALSDPLTVSARAAKQPRTRLGLKAGDSISVRAATRATAVKSANDAALVLAEALAGDERAFVRKMNRRAQELGLRKTRFANASGLPAKGNVTTARDMARLSRVLLRSYPDYYAIFGVRAISWAGVKSANHNRLLGGVSGVDGIKTGYTADAGYNLAASARRGDSRVVAVVLHAPSGASRDTRVANLLELGFLRAAKPASATPRTQSATVTRPRAPASAPTTVCAPVPRETAPSGRGRAGRSTSNPSAKPLALNKQKRKDPKCNAQSAGDRKTSPIADSLRSREVIRDRVRGPAR